MGIPYILHSDLDKAPHSLTQYLYLWCSGLHNLRCRVTPGLSKDIWCHIHHTLFTACKSPDQTSGARKMGCHPGDSRLPLQSEGRRVIFMKQNCVNARKTLLRLSYNDTYNSSAQRQKGLTGYCFKYKDRPLCLRTNDMYNVNYAYSDSAVLIHTYVSVCYGIILQGYDFLCNMQHHA